MKRLDKFILLIIICIKGIGKSKILKAFKGEFKLELKYCLELDAKELLEKVNEFLGLKKAITKEELENAIIKAKNILKNCEKDDIKFVGYFEKEYPMLLRKIDKPPIILYYKGNLKQINESVNIALIGTRKPSEWSASIGKQIATRLVNEKITIVSGLASGCDTVGHSIAVENKAPTIAYMPCGLDSIYPLKNKELSEKILENGGCLISEYTPGSKALKSHFGERDRLQSGSSNGVIVLESSAKGGTMITAGCAIVQKRKLAVLWKRKTKDLNNNFENAKGNSLLVKDGAELIECMADLRKFIEKCKSYKELKLLPDYEDKDGLRQLRIFEEQMVYKIKADRVFEEKASYGEKENKAWQTPVINF